MAKDQGAQMKRKGEYQKDQKLQWMGKYIICYNLGIHVTLILYDLVFTSNLPFIGKKGICQATIGINWWNLLGGEHYRPKGLFSFINKLKERTNKIEHKSKEGDRTY
jgi:hypothetical protein